MARLTACSGADREAFIGCRGGCRCLCCICIGVYMCGIEERREGEREICQFFKGVMCAVAGPGCIASSSLYLLLDARGHTHTHSQAGLTQNTRQTYTLTSLLVPLSITITASLINYLLHPTFSAFAHSFPALCPMFDIHPHHSLRPPRSPTVYVCITTSGSQYSRNGASGS